MQLHDIEAAAAMYIAETLSLHSVQNVSFQGEDADEDDAYQVLSTLKRITAFHKYDICSLWRTCCLIHFISSFLVFCTLNSRTVIYL